MGERLSSQKIRYSVWLSQHGNYKPQVKNSFVAQTENKLQRLFAHHQYADMAPAQFRENTSTLSTTIVLFLFAIIK
jgi:hypothetical protein